MNTLTQNTKKWLSAWQDVAPILEEERVKEIRQADCRQIIRETRGLVIWFYKNNPLPDMSGLVDQQRYFRSSHE